MLLGVLQAFGYGARGQVLRENCQDSSKNSSKMVMLLTTGAAAPVETAPSPETKHSEP